MPQKKTPVARVTNNVESLDYRPIISNGIKSNEAPVVFFWSATDPESITAFRKLVFPLYKGQSRSVVLAQVFSNTEHDMRGPGALLMCARNAKEYGIAALRYLKAASPPLSFKEINKSTVGATYTNEALEKITDEGLISLSACREDPKSYRRVLRSIADSSQFLKNHSVPSVSINGVNMGVSDPRITSLIPH